MRMGRLMEPPAAADDVPEPEKVLIQQLEQQFGRPIRQLYRSELHFLRSTCTPTRDQYRKIAAEGEPAVTAVIKEYAEAMGGHRRVVANVNKPYDPRQTIADALAVHEESALADPARTARVLRTIGESYKNFSVVAMREAELRAELARVPDVVTRIPTFDNDIGDVEGLAAIGDYLYG